MLMGPAYCLFFFLVLKGLLDNAERPLIRVLAGTIFILVVSGLLFGVKLYRLRVYAALEFCFAVAVTAQTLWSMKDVVKPVEMLSLVTAAYLMIRSMDNFKNGHDEARKRKAASGGVMTPTQMR
jgi:hypothetical protein